MRVGSFWDAGRPASFWDASKPARTHTRTHTGNGRACSKKVPKGTQMTPKSVDPWSECLDPSSGGRFTSPLPPSAGHPRRLSGQILGAEFSKSKAESFFRPGHAKTSHPKGVSPQRVPLGYFNSGFAVFAAKPRCTVQPRSGFGLSALKPRSPATSAVGLRGFGIALRDFWPKPWEIALKLQSPNHSRPC